MNWSALSEVEQLVIQFLQSLEARDLPTAEAMLAPNALIIFPGGKRFRSLAELVEASRGRYRWVKKTFDRVESISSTGEDIVYVMGSLFGVNNLGVEFSGVRYIDRFTLAAGRIVAHEVWNDLAESGMLDRLP